MSLSDLAYNGTGTISTTDANITSTNSERYSGANWTLTMLGNFDSDTNLDTISFTLRVDNMLNTNYSGASNTYFGLSSAGGTGGFRITDVSGDFTDGLSVLEGVTALLKGSVYEAGAGSITLTDGENSEVLSGTTTLTNSYDLTQVQLTGSDNGIRYFDFDFFANVKAVPEPSSLALLAVGGVAMTTRRRRS